MSNTTPKPNRPWLEQHYQATRERTVQLVKAAVDRLVKDGRAVTIDTICQMSQQLDPQGKGIKRLVYLEMRKRMCIINNTVLRSEGHHNAVHANLHQRAIASLQSYLVMCDRYADGTHEKGRQVL